MEIAITGMGIVSAIGNNVAENFAALKLQKTGIKKAVHLDSRLKNSHAFGEVSLSNSKLKEELGISGNQSISRSSLLGIKAIKESIEGLPKIENTGLISGTTNGGMDLSEAFFKEWQQQNNLKNIEALLTHDCGDTTLKMSQYFGNFDYINTISTACSSAANAFILGSNLLKTKRLNRVIVGGVDPLTFFTANGFNSLMILDKEWCKPFSENRAGLNLGEAAAFLVLENLADAKAHNHPVKAMLTGYANTNDAYHQTASSAQGDGAFLAMKQALAHASLHPNNIDYINAHGTGTKNNDASEWAALQRVFGKKTPPFSSTKSFTGHTLGAAGAVEAVYSLLAIQHQVLFPNLNCQNSLTQNVASPISSVASSAIDHVLSNSFGFGGNCTSLVFSKPQI